MFKKSVFATALVILSISPCHLSARFQPLGRFNRRRPPLKWRASSQGRRAIAAASSRRCKVAINCCQKLHAEGSHRLRVRPSIAPDIGRAVWIEGDTYNILAATPGDGRPNQTEQMAIVRKLLDERFRLRYHLEQRELPVYLLSVAKKWRKA